MDGDKGDDVVKTKPASIPAANLKPSQDAIYLGKALGMAIGGVEGGDLGAIISSDNYILLNLPLGPKIRGKCTNAGCSHPIHLYKSTCNGAEGNHSSPRIT